MSDTFLTDLGSDLQSHGLGILGTDLFEAQFPASLSPDTVASVIIETGGGAPDNASRFEFPRVQITTRSTDYGACRIRARAIFDRLNNFVGPIGPTPTPAGYCRALQQPTNIGKDENLAWRIVCNYEFSIDKAP